MKIEPRKQSDRGGYLMMPLVDNIPIPKDATWKETTCPVCGNRCWERKLPDGFSEDMFEGKLCTMCALKLEMGKKG